MTDLAVIMSIYKNDKLKFVKESVQSILSQTFTQFHYYLIFDGPVSADIEEYITNLRDIRLRLFKSQINMGLAKAMNQLLNEVLNNPEYKFIARMDADDISNPDRFDKQRNFLKANLEISCLGSFVEIINQSGNVHSLRKLPIKNEDMLRNYYYRSPLVHPSIMFRKSFFSLAGLYPTDTILMEDNVLWGNAFAVGLRFANLPDFLLKFRVDKAFYKRRSGIKYGYKFIRTRFAILKSLKADIRYYIYSLVLGLVRMLPPVIIKLIYKLYLMVFFYVLYTY